MANCLLALPCAFFVLALVTNHGWAISSQEDYWTTKLSNVPMPQAIKDGLLHSTDADHDADNENKMGPSDVTKTSSKVQRGVPFYYMYSVNKNKAGAKKEKSTIPLRGVPFYYTYSIEKGEADLKKEKTLTPLRGVPFYYTYNMDNNNEVGDKKEKSPAPIRGVPFYYTYSVDKKGADLNKEKTLRGVPFYYTYNMNNNEAGVNREKSHAPMRGVPFYYTYSVDKDEAGLNKEKTPTPLRGVPFYYTYNVDNNEAGVNKEKKPPTPLRGVPFQYRYNMDSNEAGVNKEKSSTPVRGVPFYYTYSVDKDEAGLNKEKTPTPLRGVPFQYRYNMDSNEAGVNKERSSTPMRGVPFYYTYSMDTVNQEDTSLEESLFFLAKDLHLGGKMKENFQKMVKTNFLPQDMAESSPFSTDKLAEIFERFSITPESTQATEIKDTLFLCLENPGMMGENRYCPKTMEALVDYVVSEIGKEVKLITTTTPENAPIGIQEYEITSLKKLSLPGDTAVPCHKMSFPHTVYYCHHPQNLNAYSATLTGPNGVQVDRLVVCHLDTSMWKPNSVALQQLKIRPGDFPVCHFSFDSDMFWVTKNSTAKSMDVSQ